MTIIFPKLQLVLNIFARCVRNIRTTPHFWTGYMLAAERARLPDDQVDAVLERARFGYARPEHGVRIWLEYVGQVCRRVTAKSHGKRADATMLIADRVMCV